MSTALSRENALVLLDELEDLVDAIDGGRAENGAGDRLQRLIRSLEGLPVADRARLDSAIRKLDAWGRDLLDTRDRRPTGPGSPRDVVDAQLAGLRDLLEVSP